MRASQEGGKGNEWTSTKEVRFGDLVRGQRHQAGLTLRDVARALGVSISYLSDVELGNRKPFKGASLVALAEILGIEIERLQEAAAREEGVLIKSSDPGVLEAASLLREKRGSLSASDLESLRKILGG